MQKTLIIFLLLLSIIARSQNRAENIIIITTDGFRWQEIFNGMDSVIANNNKFNEGDSELIFKKYWANNVNERREKLMPFLWKYISTNGSIYGNRKYDNYVNVMNTRWFSYPGYSEIMTGFVDTAIDRNSYPVNPNVNVLEFLNQQPKFKGKVAAFGAWDAFDRILNEQRAGFPVVSAFDKAGGKNPDANEKLINAMNSESYKPFNEGECLDVFTHFAAKEWLMKKKPKVLYIAYGETDEWAHAGKYRSYLDAAHQVDDWIRQIWEYIQSDPQYKNKTALFITCDHGRGSNVDDQWTKHWSDVPGSNEIWFAVIGAGIQSQGEVKTSMQIYQQQYAQTFARLLGYFFKTNHPVAEEIKQLFK